MRIGNKEPEAIYAGKRIIAYIMKGMTVLWQSVRSCFGAGYWLTEYPWSDEDGWKNNS